MKSWSFTKTWNDKPVRRALVTGALLAGASVSIFGLYATAASNGSLGLPRIRMDRQGQPVRPVDEPQKPPSHDFQSPLPFLTLDADASTPQPAPQRRESQNPAPHSSAMNQTQPSRFPMPQINPHVAPPQSEALPSIRQSAMQQETNGIPGEVPLHRQPSTPALDYSFPSLPRMGDPATRGDLTMPVTTPQPGAPGTAAHALQEAVQDPPSSHDEHRAVPADDQPLTSSPLGQQPVASSLPMIPGLDRIYRQSANHPTGDPDQKLPAHIGDGFDGGLFQFDAAPMLHAPERLQPKPMVVPSYVASPATIRQQGPVQTADHFVQSDSPNAVMTHQQLSDADLRQAAAPQATRAVQAVQRQPARPAEPAAIPTAPAAPGTPGSVTLAPGQTPNDFIAQEREQARAALQDAGVGYADQGGEVLPADCGLGCPSSWYVQAEALHIENDGLEQATLTQEFRSGHFGFATGGRLTVGYRRDCLDGFEFVGIWPMNWVTQSSLSGTDLQSFITADQTSGLDSSGFDNARFHLQTYSSEFSSIEFNQKWWGWDVFSCVAGMRYMQYDENFSLFSLAPRVAGGDDVGFFEVSTENKLVGPQIGFDFFYPISGWSLIWKFRTGAYVNFSRLDTVWLNNGAVQIANSNDKYDWAVNVESGYYLSRRLTSNVSVRIGYEAWYIYQTALGPDQVFGTINAATGTRAKNDGDVFFHGGSVGLEVAW